MKRYSALDGVTVTVAAEDQLLSFDRARSISGGWHGLPGRHLRRQAG